MGRIADALLAEGVAQIPLRDLAAMLGTSDRMLLYYFEDKADLVRASIAEVSARLGARMVAIAGPPRAADQVLRNAAGFLSSPEVLPFMRVWADVSARGGRGEAPFAEIAQGSVQGSLAWLEAQLDLDDARERRRVAAAVLAIVEGARLLEMASPGSMGGVTELVARRLKGVGRSRRAAAPPAAGDTGADQLDMFAAP